MLAALRSANSQAMMWSIVALLLASFCLFVGLYFYLKTGVEFGLLYRDPNAIAKQPFYYGILESSTSAIMISSGAVLLFTALSEPLDRKSRRFLWPFGTLTLLLGLDDLIMIHESTTFFHWRLTESVIYAFYGLILFVSLFCNLQIFLRTKFVLLSASILLLAFAGLQDKSGVKLFGFNTEDFIEIFGFSFWFSYALSTSLLFKRSGY